MAESSDFIFVHHLLFLFSSSICMCDSMLHKELAVAVLLHSLHYLITSVSYDLHVLKCSNHFDMTVPSTGIPITSIIILQ